MTTRTENDALIELARSADATVAPFIEAEGLHGVVLPPDHDHRLVDLERFAAQPRRKRGQIELHTPKAFTAFAQRHHSGEGIDSPVVIYADAEQGRFTAVLNDATAGLPGWGDHRAVLTLKQTEPWKLWASRDGKIEGQVEFAKHIENGLPEIIDPPAADMLELAQHFNASTRVNFKQAHRLRDGRKALEYEETIEAKAGERGTISIPDVFHLALVPYEGSAVVEVIARLRYRIDSGSLRIGYELVRPKEVQRAAFDAAVDEVAAEIKDAQLFHGRAPEPRA